MHLAKRLLSAILATGITVSCLSTGALSQPVFAQEPMADDWAESI